MKGGRVAARVKVNVERLKHGRRTLGREKQSATGIAPDLIHLLWAEELKGIHPSLLSVARTNLHEAPPDVNDADAVAMFQHRGAAVLLIQLAPQVKRGGSYIGFPKYPGGIFAATR